MSLDPQGTSLQHPETGEPRSIPHIMQLPGEDAVWGLGFRVRPVFFLVVEPSNIGMMEKKMETTRFE